MPNGSEDSKRNLICFPLSFTAQTRASISRLGFAARQPNDKVMVTHTHTEQNVPLISLDNTEFKSSHLSGNQLSINFKRFGSLKIA